LIPLPYENQASALGPPLIGALLRVPWEAVNERMLAGLHDRGFDDLVPAHLSVMQYPGPDNMRPSDLAARTGMTRQALNYLLGQMEQRGYIERVEEDDPRFKRIHLTARGVAMGEAMREAVREVEAEWIERLGAERYGTLRDLLTALNEPES
jgi:DNA-binding MarR family transcriptional regulator